MLFRSSNSKFVHYGGDILSNTDDSSHGVHLTGGTTGGIVQPCGDEANVRLTVRGKGTGALTLGSSVGALTLNSSAVTVGAGSTTAIATIQRFLVQWTVPALSSAGAAGSAADSTVTLAAATTNAIYVLQQRVPYNSTTDPGLQHTVRCSTAAELKITSWNLGPDTLSGSTVSAYLLQVGF